MKRKLFLATGVVVAAYLFLAGMLADGACKARRTHRAMQALVGKRLDSKLAARLPEKDCSTKEGAVLGYLRAILSGSFRDRLFYETGALLADTLAECEQTMMPEKDLDAPWPCPVEDCFPPARVMRVECLPANAPTQFTLYLQEEGRPLWERWTRWGAWTNGEGKIDREDEEWVREASPPEAERGGDG